MMLPCSVIQDLLPSYIEDLTAPETTALVEEHLDGCEECRAAKQAMEADMKMKKSPPFKTNFLRTLKRRQIAGAVLSALTALLCMLWLYNAEFSVDVSSTSSLEAAVDEYNFTVAMDVNVVETEKVKNRLFVLYEREDVSGHYGLAELEHGLLGKYRFRSCSNSDWGLYNLTSKAVGGRDYLLIYGTHDLPGVDSFKIFSDFEKTGVPLYTASAERAPFLCVVETEKKWQVHPAMIGYYDADGMELPEKELLSQLPSAEAGRTGGRRQRRTRACVCVYGHRSGPRHRVCAVLFSPFAGEKNKIGSGPLTGVGKDGIFFTHRAPCPIMDSAQRNFRFRADELQAARGAEQGVAMIEARKLCKSYRKQPVLREASFSLEKGKVLGILGPNGAGKTTLIRILALITGADNGTLTIDGRDAFAEAGKLRPLIGYVPQDVALFEDLTVRENLLCWSARPGRDARRQAERLIGDLDLGAFASKKVAALSGGMKRRTNLAVALLDDPEILILDEPLVGVDIEQRRQILTYLKALAGRGVTQLMASHHVDELLPLADEILIMKDGEVRFCGGGDALRARFAARTPGTTPDEIVMEILDNGNGREAHKK